MDVKNGSIPQSGDIVDIFDQQAKQRGGNEKNKETTRDQRAREGVIEEQKEDVRMLRMSPRRANTRRFAFAAGENRWWRMTMVS